VYGDGFTYSFPHLGHSNFPLLFLRNDRALEVLEASTIISSLALGRSVMLGPSCVVKRSVYEGRACETPRLANDVIKRVVYVDLCRLLSWPRCAQARIAVVRLRARGAGTAVWEHDRAYTQRQRTTALVGLATGSQQYIL